MFLSEWRQFPSAPCLTGKKKLDDISRLDVVEIARVSDCLQELNNPPIYISLLPQLSLSFESTRPQNCPQ